MATSPQPGQEAPTTANQAGSWQYGPTGASFVPTDTAQPAPTTANASGSTPTANVPAVNTGQPSPQNPTGTPTPTTLQAGTPPMGTANLGSTMKQAFATTQNSNTPPPQDSGMASAAVQGAINKVPQPTNDTAVVSKLQQDPGYQQLLQDKAQYNSVANQGESLLNQYKDLEAQYHIPGINTELINMKNVIDGTQDDIRKEITSAGGFATESQVLGMASARNKQVIQNYNNLLATKTDAENQVNTMIGLAKDDQANATQAINEKLNIDKQIADYTDKFNTNAKEGFNSVISAVGVSGLYNALINTDPTGASVTSAEQALGLQPGMLKQEAATDYKTRQAQENLQKTEASTAETNAKTAALALKAQTEAGLPNPAYANKPGFDSTGVKYTISSASQEVRNLWKQNNAQGKDGYVSPATYNNALAQWVANGLSAADFRAEFGSYANPKDVSNKLINS